MVEIFAVGAKFGALHSTAEKTNKAEALHCNSRNCSQAATKFGAERGQSCPQQASTVAADKTARAPSFGCGFAALGPPRLCGLIGFIYWVAAWPRCVLRALFKETDDDQRLPAIRQCSLALLSAVLLAGCATFVGKLPPADLKEPGWTVREGQAIWHIPAGNREIAGDVLVATRPDGGSFVQFSKSPFALVIAQESSKQWQVEFPPQNKHYAGRGNPPKRIIWLYLPRVLTGQTPPAGWSWHQDASGWRLVNSANGESLEGFFNS